ncbi:hypothetical protein [Brevibacillus centrosporus]
MHILPFTADMVEDAAKLLASRLQKDRLATAALPLREGAGCPDRD